LTASNTSREPFGPAETPVTGGDPKRPKPQGRRLLAGGSVNAKSVTVAELRTEGRQALARAYSLHGRMVYNVCLRVLGNSQAAEDSTQAVFVLLLQKAHLLRKEVRLAGWLHRASEFVARKARIAEHRRAKREREGARLAQASGQSDAQSAAIWKDLTPRLDREVAALPENYRTPLVLVYLEGLEQREVARALGLNAATLRWRLHHGMEKLRARLGTKSTLSSAVLGGVLLQHALGAMPPAHLAGAVMLAAGSKLTSAGGGLRALLQRGLSRGGSWTTSAGVHAAIVVVAALLGLSYVPRQQEPAPVLVVSARAREDKPEFLQPTRRDIFSWPGRRAKDQEKVLLPSVESGSESSALEDVEEGMLTAKLRRTDARLGQIGPTPTSAIFKLAVAGKTGRTSGSGRGPRKNGGGNGNGRGPAGTVSAVELALRWLASVQNADGSWSWKRPTEFSPPRKTQSVVGRVPPGGLELLALRMAPPRTGGRPAQFAFAALKAPKDFEIVGGAKRIGKPHYRPPTKGPFTYPGEDGTPSRPSGGGGDRLAAGGGGSRQPAHGRKLISKRHIRYTIEKHKVKVGETDPADLAATSLAVLAFLGAGETHAKGEYRKVIFRGLEWIARNQTADGAWRSPSDGQEMHAHGLATFALVEGYLAAPADAHAGRFRTAAQKGLDFAAAHCCGNWAWSYKPRYRVVEQSATFWNTLALATARGSALRVPPRAAENLARWLELSRGADGRYARCGAVFGNDIRIMTRRSSPGMNAAGLAMRLLTFSSTADARDLLTAELVLATMKDDWEPGDYPRALRQENYFLHHGTLAMYLMGGKHWQRWGPWMTRRVIDSQCRNGSWRPDMSYLDSRVASTALATLSLEVHYGRLRIYARAARNLRPNHPRGAAIASPAPSRSNPIWTFDAAGASRGARTQHQRTKVTWAGLDAALKIARRDGRALALLFTARSSEGPATFAYPELRRKLRSLAIIPVRLRPPERLAGNDPRKKTYARLCKKYRAQSDPTLIFAAPDGTVLIRLVKPNGNQVHAALHQLPQLLKAYARKKPAKKQAAAVTSGRSGS
jgi:RNA polymerase sigma factor (sigma-70 family)